MVESNVVALHRRGTAAAFYGGSARREADSICPLDGAAWSSMVKVWIEL